MTPRHTITWLLTAACMLALIVFNTPSEAEVYQVHLFDTERAGKLAAKQGDMISLHDFNHTPGNATKKNYFILNVDFGNEITTRNDARKLMVPHFVDGSLDSSSPAAQEANSRFAISFADIDTLAIAAGHIVDWDEVAKEVPYQPLYDNEVVFSFADLIKDKYADAKMVANDIKAVAVRGNMWKCDIQGKNGTFSEGEPLSFLPSGATASYASDDGKVMRFYVTSGVPLEGDQVTGALTSARANFTKLTDDHATPAITSVIGP